MLGLSFSSILMRCRRFVFVPVGDPTFGQVVGGHLHHDFVSRENANKVQPHLPGNVSEDAVSVRQFDSEHGVREQLDNFAFYFNSVFLGHVNTSG